MKKDYNHIINVDSEHEQVQHKGNLYLGSVSMLKKYHHQQFTDKNIRSVLSIIDTFCYQHYKIALQIQQIKVNHKWINLEDIKSETIYPYFNDSYQYIKHQLSNHNVYVHCKMGMSRSASLVIAFIMRQFGYSYQEALKFTKLKRPIVEPNINFVKDLQRYEQQLREKGTIKNQGNYC